MLVKFQTRAHADILMFGEVALTLIRLMGHSGTVPGALLVEDLPLAHARLQAAVTASPEQPLNPRTKANADDDSETASVTLKQRALPLLELLRAAEEQGCHVLWDLG